MGARAEPHSNPEEENHVTVITSNVIVIVVIVLSVLVIWNLVAVLVSTEQHEETERRPKTNSERAEMDEIINDLIDSVYNMMDDPECKEGLDCRLNHYEAAKAEHDSSC